MRVLVGSVSVVGLIGLFIGCAPQASNVPEVAVGEASPAAFNTAGGPTVEFSVPDMMCAEGCGAKVHEILAGQPAVKDVQIDFESKTAVVAVENDQFDADAAIAAMVDQQFDNTTLKVAEN